MIKSLIEGFHAAYRVPRNRDFLHESALAVSLALASAIPLAAATVLIVFGVLLVTDHLGWISTQFTTLLDHIGLRRLSTS